MKGNIFLTVTAILISVLAGYGFFAANSGEPYTLLLSVGSGLCLAISLVGTFGVKIEEKSANINFKVVSAIFFVLFLITNLIFGFVGVKIAPYIIINGILLLIYAIIEYGIVKNT